MASETIKSVENVEGNEHMGISARGIVNCPCCGSEMASGEPTAKFIKYTCKVCGLSDTKLL